MSSKLCSRDIFSKPVLPVPIDPDLLRSWCIPESIIPCPHENTRPPLFFREPPTSKPHPRYVSPRKRAQRTFELLNLGFKHLPWRAHGAPSGPGEACNAKIEVTGAIREWDYGDYEGVTSAEIRGIRAAQGLPPGWDIWRDGCPGGESPGDVTARLDALIADIRRRWQAPCLGGQARAPADGSSGDVLVVGHGHILRAFAMRWVGKSLSEGPTFLMEAGGVGTLSYEHHSIAEPAILLGGAFIVDSAEEEIAEAARG